MDVSLRQIRAFVSVAHLKSFTRAAKLLHVAQPTLTVQIRRLEDALALRLFDRSSRSVDLTRVGRDLLPVFQRMIHDLDTTILDARDLATKRRGIVRIATLPSVAAGILPNAILSFREQHPGVSFVVKDAIARRVLGYVRAEEVDLGVVGGDVGEADVEVLHRTEDHMHVIFPAGHAIEDAPQVTIDVLAAYPLILMDPETSVRQIVDAAFIAAGQLPIPACEATYMMTAVGMVRAGLGLTILPGAAREIRAEPTLRSRVIDDVGFTRPLSLIKKAGRTLPPLSEAFACDLVSKGLELT